MGIIRHQGENDSINESDTNTYGERFIKMITSIRDKLGNADIPVIVGGLGDSVKNYTAGGNYEGKNI